MARRKTPEQKARDRIDKLCARASRLWPALTWGPHPWRRAAYVACAHVGAFRVVLACPPGSHTLVVTEGGDDAQVALMVAGVDLARIAPIAAQAARGAGLPARVVRALTA